VVGKGFLGGFKKERRLLFYKKEAKNFSTDFCGSPCA
jgi:hypothetical protein